MTALRAELFSDNEASGIHGSDAEIMTFDVSVAPSCLSPPSSTHQTRHDRALPWTGPTNKYATEHRSVVCGAAGRLTVALVVR